MRCRAVVMSVLVLAGCGASGPAAPTTDPTTFVPTSPATSSPTTTGAPTTVAVTTATAVTTAPTTSPAPATTAAPTTTSDALSPVEQAVVDAVMRSFELFAVALRDPFDEAKVAAALDAYAGDAAASSRSVIDRYRDAGLASRVSAELPGRLVVDLSTLSMLDDGARAVVAACWRNSDVLVEVGTGSGGDDVVVDDSVSMVPRVYEVTSADGEWRVTQILDDAILPGAAECVD